MSTLRSFPVERLEGSKQLFIDIRRDLMDLTPLEKPVCKAKFTPVEIQKSIIRHHASRFRSLDMIDIRCKPTGSGNVCLTAISDRTCSTKAVRNRFKTFILETRKAAANRQRGWHWRLHFQCAAVTQIAVDILFRHLELLGLRLAQVNGKGTDFGVQT